MVPLPGIGAMMRIPERLEALGDVVLQSLYLGDLDALGLHDLVERHRGAHRGLDALDAECRNS